MSNENMQDECQKIVEREVIYNQTSVVNHLLDRENDLGFDWDSIENLYIPTCYKCGHINMIASECDGCTECNDDEDDNGYYDSEVQEILEWWLVTEWFSEKLAKKGEPILRADGSFYWGRTTSGQAIYIDSVIKDIVKDLKG